MSPMRDTMRFIDGDQRNVDAGQEPVQFANDPFGGDVKQFHLSLYAELSYPVAFFLRHHAVERSSRYAIGDQPSTWSFIRAIREILRWRFPAYRSPEAGNRSTCRHP